MSAAVCGVCPHHCRLSEGQTGLCRARMARNGFVQPISYGKLTSLALDPIEKKPLRRFYPGSLILSCGSFGCNLRCPYCQNHEISMAGAELPTAFVSPEALADKAERLQSAGNIGVAFTYNEPLVSPEYVADCARLLRKRNLKTVLVTNGYVDEGLLREILPLIDAMNIDLKGFSEECCRFVGGSLAPVKRAIELAAESCHVEVTTLIVPGVNDDARLMREQAGWLASLSPGLPLHISRFFPRHLLADRDPTPVETVLRLCDAAREQLEYVYPGNC